MYRPILLVDDDDAFATLFKRAVADSGVRDVKIYRVVDGPDAVRYLRRADHIYRHAVVPEMIFLDLNLPGATGLEVLEQLKAAGPPLPPVVVLTTFADPVRRFAAESLGATRYLEKPANYDDLVALLQRELRRLPPLKDARGSRR